MGNGDHFYCVLERKSNETPCLSIVIVTFNRERLLRLLLESLLRQPEVESIEVVVVDNGSSIALSEVTLDLIRGFSSYSVFRREENTFSTEPWLIGIRSSRGKYVVTPGDDDVPTPDFLRIFHELAEAEDASILAAGMRHIDEDGKSLGVYSIPPNHVERAIWMGLLLCVNPFALPATAFLREGLDLSEAPGTRFAMDWWIWNVSAARGKVITTDLIAINYRVHQGQERHSFTSDLTGLEGARSLLSVMDSASWRTELGSLSQSELEQFCGQVMSPPFMNHGDRRWLPLLEMRLVDVMPKWSPLHSRIVLAAHALEMNGSNQNLDFLSTVVGSRIKEVSELVSKRPNDSSEDTRHDESLSLSRGDFRFQRIEPILRWVAQSKFGDSFLLYLNRAMKRKY